jgi:hypothetical protein
MGSTPDKVIEFFSIHLILQPVLGPGVHSASNINEYHREKKIILVSRARSEREADNLIAIYESIV